MGFDSAAAAEEAFYAAFAANDLAAMMQVWAPGPDVICIHPGGPRLEGPDDIRRSWAAILDQRVHRQFVRRGLKVLGTGTERIHLLEENISVPGTAMVAPPVLATNVYQCIEGRWFMVLHHGSVAPAALPRLRAVPTTARSEHSLH